MTSTTGAARLRSGIALNVAAAAVYSTAGLFTRVLALDVWTILVWRGLFSGLLLFGMLLVTHRAGTWSVLRRLGLPGLGVALASTAATILYIHALRRTSVADVAVVYAAAPFVTAVLSRWLFGERQDRATLAASLAALVGVLVMVGGGLGAGHLFGDTLALGMTISMAAAMIAIHRYPGLPMVGAACLSSVLSAVLVWPLASPWAVTGPDLGILALFGAQLGIGLLLLTLGTRLLPPTASALIGTLDAPLAPVWVWLAFDEVPSWATVLGGALVMAGVIAHVVAGERRPSRFASARDAR